MALNTGYVKSIEGILKLLEFIAFCIAFACLADFDSDLQRSSVSSEFKERFVFFMVVFVIGWVVVLVVFCVFLFSAEGNIMTEKNWNLLLLVFSALFAVLFFISSGLIADNLNDLYDAGWNKFRPLKKYSDILTLSVFFGFLSAVLLLVDAFVTFKKVRG